MSVRRALAPLAVALLTSLLATGCGGSGSTPAKAISTPTPTPTSSAALANPLGPHSKIKLERPKAAATILPSGSLSAVPGTAEIYSAKDARTIEGFPIPKGAKVTDPGAIDQTWQFDIATTKPAAVLEFYKEVLPQMGYRVRIDVTYQQAYEKVRWDLVFDGRVSGSMVADRVHHTVFVVVNPPGQPAFVGDQQP